MGRAARNSAGRVILYADVITDSMRNAISVTDARRLRQQAYNLEHGIDPQTIQKAVTDLVAQFRSAAGNSELIPESAGAPLPRGSRSRSDRSRRAGQRVVESIGASLPSNPGELPREELTRLVGALEAEMHQAATDLRFEYAARLRDEVKSLKRELREVG
jgi:excinuclease ABC subunit B